MSSDTLVFVHLSDLHIRARDLTGGPGQDAELRNELREDLLRLREQVGTPNTILIGGDVAYAGQEAEYAYAVKWLRELCEALGMDRIDALVVPGNHDVDRAVVNRSMILQTVHAAFRCTPPLSLDQVDDLLRAYLLEDAQGHMLLDPLAAYNRFALRFGCLSKHDQLFWERDYKLNDGSALRLRGVNSALISDGNDDSAVNRLALGSNQATMSRESGVAYLFLCHHPPADWLIDPDSLDDLINNKAAVQLFGHKHRQRHWQLENVVRIQSGALHPDRKEAGWDPRYNVLELWVDGMADTRHLVVRAWPRRWSPADQQFHPVAGVNGQVFWERRVPLPAWSSPRPKTRSDPPPAMRVALSVQSPQERGAGTEEDPMEKIRELTYDFFDLPYQDRMEIVVALHLLREEDRGLSEAEQEGRVLRRVQEEDGMAEKFAAAIRAHGSRP